MLFALQDDTKYLLNLQVQEVGYFLQNSILQLNFWTDAFGQLREGGGRAVDGNAAEAWWMNAWMIFYQAWWCVLELLSFGVCSQMFIFLSQRLIIHFAFVRISWSAFVGLFVARISRGRTVGEVILYSMVAPVLYCIMWFCIWGGTGLRQARQATELEELGKLHFGDGSYYLHPGSEFCYDVPQESVYVNGTVLIFENNLPGITPVCKFDSSNADQSAFNVLYSFSFPNDLDNGLGPFLSVVFLIALIIYFATSSDSGSFVVDHLSANGRLHHHWTQRLFWAVTEGAVATALLSAGGAQALQAIQSASIVAGLPFTVLMLFLVPAIGDFAQQAVNEPDSVEFDLSEQPQFDFPLYGGIWNYCEYAVSLGSVNQKRVEKGMDLPRKGAVMEFFKALILPFLSLHHILCVIYPRSKAMNILTTGTYTVLFYTAFALLFTIPANAALAGFAWGVFFSAGILLGVVRNGFRDCFNLHSNVAADFFGASFLWPQVLAQMMIECTVQGLPSDKPEDEFRPDVGEEVAVDPTAEATSDATFARDDSRRSQLSA